MRCDRCGQDVEPPGITSLPIHYGRKVDKTSSAVRDSSNLNLVHTTTVTTYDIGGHTAVSLCARCVRTHRLRVRLIGLALVIGGIVIMGTFGNSIPWLGALGVPVLLLGVPVIAWSIGRGLGERWARSRADHALRKSTGCDTFWTDKQYAQLQRRS